MAPMNHPGIVVKMLGDAMRIIGDQIASDQREAAKDVIPLIDPYTGGRIQ